MLLLRQKKTSIGSFPITEEEERATVLSEPLSNLHHSTAQHGEVPAPCLQPSVTPKGGTQ